MLTFMSYTENKGRGIFAYRFISAGTLIEEAPIIEIPREELSHLKATQLYNYFFKWPNKGGAIALGYASLYNHSFSPNAYYIKKIPERIIAIYAYQNIYQGEEICINYNGDPQDQSALWFQTT